MAPIKVIPISAMYTAVWGKQGEHNAVNLSWDLTGWENAWPAGGPSVAFRRADGKEYAHTFEREGNILLIPILDYDTEIAGSCAVVISWIDNGNEARSVIVNGRINASIVSLGKTPDAPEKGLIEQLNAAAANASASATASEEASSEAFSSSQEAYARAMEAKVYRDSSRENSDTALNAKIEAERAAENAKESELSSQGHSHDAQNHAAAAGNYANNAKSHAEDAQKALANMEERYYVPNVDGDGNLTFTPTSDEMPSVPASNIRGPKGADANVLVINSIPYVNNWGKQAYKANKTYDEIKQAIADGKACFLKCEAYDDGIYSYLDEEEHATYGLRLRFVTPAKERKYETYTGMAYHFLYVQKLNDNVMWSVSPARAPSPNAIRFTGAVNATYDGSAGVTVEIPEGGGNELPDFTTSDAGKILYIASTGKAAWLSVGAGITIDNGVLRLNIKTGGDVSFTENADGSVTLNGVSFTVNDDGSVTLEGATMTEQEDGSVLIS